MRSRRSFIKQSIFGVGTLALAPIYGSALAQAVQDGVPGVLPSVLGGAPRRFVFIRKSNGLRPNEVALPSFSESEKAKETQKQGFEVDLDKHELPAWLEALAPYKKNMSILQGLSAMMSENGHHSYSSVLGAFKSGGNSISGIKRATIDFELAKLFPSPFGHVELAMRGDHTSFLQGIIAGYCAPAAHQRNYCYADPMTAYTELFKSVDNPASVSADNEMMAFIEQEEAFRASSLRGYEKAKLDNLADGLDYIRSRNQRLSDRSSTIKKYLPKLDPIHLDGGLNANTLEKQAAMTDVLVAALASGLTNVVTYTIDVLPTPMLGLPGNETDKISIHEIGHNGGYSGVPADKIREKIRIVHMDQVRTIIEKLKAVPEGGGNMFDNTVIMYFPENGETHHSKGSEAPFIVLAGDHCRLNMLGRYIRLPYHGNEGHKTIGNWYTTLLNAHGNPIEHYGDLDLEMSRKKLDQSGAIRQFLS
jgi:hypothetical protein